MTKLLWEWVFYLLIFLLIVIFIWFDTLSNQLEWILVTLFGIALVIVGIIAYSEIRKY